MKGTDGKHMMLRQLISFVDNHKIEVGNVRQIKNAVLSDDSNIHMHLGSALEKIVAQLISRHHNEKTHM
jgi:hypothetical protein